MPGPAFNISVVKQLRSQLDNSETAAKCIDGYPAHAYLGALGADLFQYLPVSTNLLDAMAATGKASLLDDKLKAEIANRPFGATYAILLRWLLPLFRSLDQVFKDIDTLDQIAAQQDMDAFIDSESVMDDLSNWYNYVSQELGHACNLAYDLGNFASSQRPSIEQNDAWWVTTAQRPYEFLRWHHTGRFATALLKHANSPEVDELFPGRRDALLAYVFGYLSHFAASVTAEPLVNNVTGGPYRTHWWRNRLVRNYVDTWTWGRYETPQAGMAGDEPLPKPNPFTHSGYMQWKDLTEADLPAKRLDLGGAPSGQSAAEWLSKGEPQALPQLPADVDALAWLWWQAISDAYDKSTLPAALADEKTFGETFRQAYLGANAVLWLMTGAARWLKPPPSTAAPCTYPPWMLFGNPPPSPHHTGADKVVTAIVEAIVAIILFYYGEFEKGAEYLKKAWETAKNAGYVDWDSLSCDLYWMRDCLYGLERALQDGLARTGLCYPLAASLGTFKGPPDHTVPAKDETGVSFCKIHMREAFPRTMYSDVFNGVQLMPDQVFNFYPASSQEYGEPVQQSKQLEGSYPDRLLDHWSSPHVSIFSDTQFPTSGHLFGDAVTVALELVVNGGAKVLQTKLPDFNLDADRGYGWKTWEPGKDANHAPVTGHLKETQES